MALETDHREDPSSRQPGDVGEREAGSGCSSRAAAGGEGDEDAPSGTCRATLGGTGGEVPSVPPTGAAGGEPVPSKSGKQMDSWESLLCADGTASGGGGRK